MRDVDFSKIRLVAVDLDGTLLPGNKTLTRRTLDALSACRERGVMLAIATGRDHIHTNPYLDQLQPEAAVMSYGAHIMIRGQTTYRRFMSPAVATQVMRAASEASLVRVISEEGDWYSAPPREDMLPLDLQKPFPYRADRVSAWELDEQQALSISKRLGCTLSQLIGSKWCSFGPRGTGKGIGLSRAMHALGVPVGQAVGFGDESCDIEFFCACGFGVAMENADDMTRLAADDHTLSCDADGVADYLEKHILS